MPEPSNHATRGSFLCLQRFILLVVADGVPLSVRNVLEKVADTRTRFGIVKKFGNLLAATIHRAKSLQAIDAGSLALSVRLHVSLAAGGDSHKPRFSGVGLGSVSVAIVSFRSFQIKLPHRA